MSTTVSCSKRNEVSISAVCSQRAKIACKIRDEYAAVKDFKLPEAASRAALLANGSANGAAAAPMAKNTTAKLIESMPAPADE